MKKVLKSLILIAVLTLILSTVFALFGCDANNQSPTDVSILVGIKGEAIDDVLVVPENITLETIKGLIEVKLKKSDDSETVVTDYTVEGFDATITTVQTVTIKIGDLQATLKVRVEREEPQPATPTAVKVDKANVELEANEATLDALKSKIVVTVVYSDESVKPVTDYVVEGFDASVKNEQTVTIKHSNLTATIKVTIKAAVVEDPTPVSLKVEPSAVTLSKEEATVDGLKSKITVTVVYSDESEAPTTEYTIEGLDADYVGPQSVAVKYGKLDANVTVTVEQGSVVPDTITVYYYNINNWTAVNCHAWNDAGTTTEWPGVVMTAVDGHEKWYKADISTAFTSVIFNDGGNGGQTGTLTVDVANLYYNGGEWVNDFIPFEGDLNITLYYYNLNNWSAVNCYAWTGPVNNGAWPGVAMTAVDGHEGWYQISISRDLTTVIFNDGAAAQTDNLTVDAANTYYNGTEWVNDFIVSDTPEPEVPTITENSVVEILVAEKVVATADLNPEAEPGKIEFMALGVALEEGYAVVVKVDGVEFNSYKVESPFQGKAEKAANYNFYIANDGIYAHEEEVVTPEAPTITENSVVEILVADLVVVAELNPEAEAGKIEFMALGVALEEGYAVVVKVDGVEFNFYKVESPFQGTVDKAANYNFYIANDGIYAHEEVVTPEVPKITENSKVEIYVTNHEVVIAELNPEAEEGKIEFMALGVALEKGDVVVIIVDGVKFNSYKVESPFQGKAERRANYNFYIANDGIYAHEVETPEPEVPTLTEKSVVEISVDDFVVTTATLNEKAEEGKIEFMALGIALVEGDAVVVTVDGVEFNLYKAVSPFQGKVEKAASYNFYIANDGIYAHEVETPEPEVLTITEKSVVEILVADKTVATATLNKNAGLGKIEFMAFDVSLAEGDVVVITVDGVEFNFYKGESPFQGKVERTANYDFYIANEGIYAYEIVVTPEPEVPTITENSVVEILLAHQVVATATLNEKAEEGKIEFMALGVALAGDYAVAVTVDGVEFNFYKVESPFQGIIEKAANYNFYISNDGIYAQEVEVTPGVPALTENSEVLILVADKVVATELNPEAKEGKIEFMVLGVALAEGDAVVVTVDGVEFNFYKGESPFQGKVEKAASYNFYIANDGIYAHEVA